MPEKKRRAGPKELALVAASILFTLVSVELFARAWVALRWPEKRVEQMTDDDNYRGRFAITAPFGYSLRPGYRSEADGTVISHNALGLRGKDIEVEKRPGQIRIAILGASTIYGFAASDDETSSAVLEQTLRSQLPGVDVSVINGGVPGWLSDDSILSFEHRILPLGPDILVVMDGRNEAWAQSFAAYRDDYEHFRTRDTARIAAVQADLRRLFRLSRIAMIFAHRAPGLFGFRPELYFPVYGRVQWRNVPSSEQVVAAVRDTERFRAFEANQRRIVTMARARGVEPVLATMAFVPERYASDFLPRDEGALKAEREMVLENIRITRAVAKEMSVPLFDAFALSKPDVMVDDCHPNKKGEQIMGRALAEIVRPLVEARTDSRRARAAP